MAVGIDTDSRPQSGAASGAQQRDLLGVLLWRALGTRRINVRADHALSGHVARNGRRTGIHRRVWHVDASDFPRRVCKSSSRNAFRIDHSGGVAICLLGIAVAGAAGVSKEREMSVEQKRASIKEFDLKKGLLVATFSGVMSACFAYGLAAGDPIKSITVQHGTAGLWQGLPVLVVVLGGGFTTNFIWCVILNVRNRTGYQYFQSQIRGGIPKRSEEHILEAITDAPAEEMAVAVAVKSETPFRAPMLPNYWFSALAGTTWYMQFFFYTMGETQMGRFKFSSWTLHMASIIIFSTLWGIALKEWEGSGTKTKLLVGLSLLVLVTSTVVVGYANYVSGAR